MAISGTKDGEFPPFCDCPGKIPFDQSKKNLDDTFVGQYDAERKLLNWGISVTKNNWIGIAELAHVGPKATCTACQLAITLWNTSADPEIGRPGIPLLGPSNWFPLDGTFAGRILQTP